MLGNDVSFVKSRLIESGLVGVALACAFIGFGCGSSSTSDAPATLRVSATQDIVSSPQSDQTRKPTQGATSTTSEPTPTPIPIQPLGTMTGVAVVDRLATAALRVDVSTLLSLTDFQDVKCESFPATLSHPICRAGEIVPSLAMSACEAQFRSRDEMTALYPVALGANPKLVGAWLVPDLVQPQVKGTKYVVWVARDVVDELPAIFFLDGSGRVIYFERSCRGFDPASIKGLQSLIPAAGR